MTTPDFFPCPAGRNDRSASPAGRIGKALNINIANALRNQLAYIRALRTKLELEEVYGINDAVLLESGERVNLFQALLSLELTSAFLQRDFLAKFVALHAKSGNSVAALSELALRGLMEGMQNRFPLTWSEREQKIRSIIGWTVCDKSPKGSLPMAASILDFWTNDWLALAARLRSNIREDLRRMPTWPVRDSRQRRGQ